MQLLIVFLLNSVLIFAQDCRHSIVWQPDFCVLRNRIPNSQILPPNNVGCTIKLNSIITLIQNGLFTLETLYEVRTEVELKNCNISQATRVMTLSPSAQFTLISPHYTLGTKYYLLSPINGLGSCLQFAFTLLSANSLQTCDLPAICSQSILNDTTQMDIGCDLIPEVTQSPQTTITSMTTASNSISSTLATNTNDLNTKYNAMTTNNILLTTNTYLVTPTPIINTKTSNGTTTFPSTTPTNSAVIIPEVLSTLHLVLISIAVFLLLLTMIILVCIFVMVFYLIRYCYMKKRRKVYKCKEVNSLQPVYINLKPPKLPKKRDIIPLKKGKYVPPKNPDPHVEPYKDKVEANLASTLENLVKARQRDVIDYNEIDKCEITSL